jgi:hypothetical protein
VLHGVGAAGKAQKKKTWATLALYGVGAAGDAGSARDDAELAQVLLQIKRIECIWFLYL